MNERWNAEVRILPAIVGHRGECEHHAERAPYVVCGECYREQIKDLRRVLRRARAAGRRLADYWRTQLRGTEGIQDLLTSVWRKEGRLRASTFERLPDLPYFRGEGPCRRCGLRCWIRDRSPDEESIGEDAVAPDLRCLGCHARHEENGKPLRLRDEMP